MRLPHILLVLIFSFDAWVMVANGMMLAQQESVSTGSNERLEGVTMPRVWMRAREVLIAAHRQVDLKYAVLLPQFEMPVGPFSIEGPTGVQELIDGVSEVMNTNAHWIGDVIVFDPRVEHNLLKTALSSTDSSQAGARRNEPHDPSSSRSDPQGSWRYRVEQLAQLGHSATIPQLSGLAGSADGSTRLHALAAMVRLEGDFMRNTWPGRLSIYEVLAEKLDRDALLFAMEEGGTPGGRVWKMAAEVLGRAREPSLTRGVWWNLWENRPGTIQMTLWCMGRCGDPSGLGPLREHIWNIATNDIADQYLAAIVLGELDAISLLAEHRNNTSVDVRRAAAMGLGACKSNEAAARVLETYLEDNDPAVQFIACQSLGRLGKTERLTRLLVDDAPNTLWIAALEALSEAGEARDILEGIRRPGGSARMIDNDPVRLAKLAEVYGRYGGELACKVLPRMLDHTDRWVRAAAAEALAKLGTSQAIRRVAALAQNPEEDADVRIAAVLGLGRSLSPEAAGPLFVVAGNFSEHYRLRQYAVLGLTRLANRAGHEKIAQLVDRNLPGFMAFAVRHVRFETPERTAAELVPLLTQGDRDSACAAAGNLSELGYAPGVRELLEGSEIFDNHTRMMHSWGAIRADGFEATSALIGAAKSRRRLIRQGAALSLGGRHTPGAVDALLQFAADEEEGVRAAAAQSLGLSADPLAIPVLVRLAEADSSRSVQAEAIRALRSRDFAGDPLVQRVFARLAGAEGDVGVLDPNRPSIDQQKANTFVLRNWAEAYEEDLNTNLTYETTICYDSHCDRVIMWGSHGRRYDSPQTGQTWFFDVKTGKWGRLADSSQWPNGTCCNRQIVFDSANKLAIVAKSGRGAAGGGHGWLNGLRGNLSFSVPWVLDVTTDEWYPMRPIKHFGNLGMVGGSYDLRHGLNVWWRGELVSYDSYANQWLRLDPPGAEPERVGNSSAVFDPLMGKLVAIGTHSTWAYDPVTNEWEDLVPSGDAAPTGAPMVYDSANDVMLALTHTGQDEMRVWVYHLRENRWEKLPAVRPAPRYGTMFDATYDPNQNVVLISGNESMSWSGALTTRETWTYRYKAADSDPKAHAGQSPLDVKVVTSDDGTSTLTWKTPFPESITGYLILRKIAENPVAGQWELIAEVAADKRVYTDAEVPGKRLIFYSVVAQRGEQPAGLPGPPVRTAPPALRWATAVVVDGGVQVRWQLSSADDVIGYHVYRADADVRWPWHDLFDPALQMGELERITSQPMTGTDLVDKGVQVEESASELYWPKTFAYVVHPVNRWGVEGGPSPVAVALADPPGAVRVIPWLNGRRLVLWSPPRSAEDVRGYHVMRMDDWHREYAFRWQAAPVASTAFYDDEELPRTDRRRYYVSGVDVQGAGGIPSSGAWSHGLP